MFDRHFASDEWRQTGCISNEGAIIVTGERCPRSGEMVDESAARVNGGLALLLLAVALFTPFRWVLAYLFADYAMKLAAGFASSPNCILARMIADVLKLERVPMDSAPKRFAATIGLMMSGLGLFTGYLAPDAVYYGVVGFFALCAGLEAIAGVCVGCVIYGLLPAGVADRFVRRPREASNGTV